MKHFFSAFVRNRYEFYVVMPFEVKEKIEKRKGLLYFTPISFLVIFNDAYYGIRHIIIAFSTYRVVNTS